MSAPSFTAFKRQLRVGTRVHINNMKYPDLTGYRTLSKVQGNAIAGWVTRSDGKEVESWLYWPRAAETRMLDEQTVTLLNPETMLPWLTVAVVES